MTHLDSRLPAIANVTDMQDTVILCDLGGVLIDLHWQERARALFMQEQDPEELKRRWLRLESARAYEAGKTDFAGFYHAFVGETGSRLNIADFEREFAGIIGPLKADCLTVLDSLRRHGTLAMLSNTNAVHVAMLRSSSDIFKPFEHLFFSYEMGMVKPDREIYEAVCRRLRKEPQQIWFFDDSEANVEAAVATGLNAYVVNSPQQIHEVLCRARL
ncbi:MAG: putative haloacid dehalogenase-like protein hydrolase [uncultured bacterium]|nr:MAG: putative haloacid dehalogenase-like protein hydrolase [uncultured bacterium]